MLEPFINFACVVAMIFLSFGVFFVGQLVIERFATKTLPIIMEVYLRIRHPERYRDK